MFKSILVCTDGSKYGDAAREYGIHLAKRVGARLAGLHVMDSRMLEGPLMADISGWVGASPYAAQLPQFRELLRDKAEAIAQAFRARAEEFGISADVVVRTGHPVPLIVEAARKAELLVIGQKGEHADFIGEMTGSTAERVSRHAERPCLVTPAEFRPINRILAAYDGSGHAGQALKIAAELAVLWSVPLTLLTVDEKGDADRMREAASAGDQLARDHGVTPDVIRAAGRAGETVLRVAEEKGCDLIAVGAFGHSRIREFFLGSAAAQISARAHCPVLMAR